MVDETWPYDIITKSSLRELQEAVREAINGKQGRVVLVGGPFQSHEDRNGALYSQAIAIPGFT